VVPNIQVLMLIVCGDVPIIVCCADIRDYSSYPAVVDWVGSHLEGEGLNVLVNNAGIAHWEGFEDITKELMLDCLESNCVAPLMLAKVLLPCCNIATV